MMTVIDKCRMMSELDPGEWVEEVLCPISGDVNGVLGNAQVAMWRDRTVGLVEGLEWTGLCGSKGEARRAIKACGVRINGKRCDDIKRNLTSGDALRNVDAIVLEFGRKNYGVIEMCD